LWPGRGRAEVGRATDRSGPKTAGADPRVSVVVPTYNRPRELTRAVESVLAQSWTDFEVLIVDDGSTDDTGRAARSFADDRVRYLRQLRNQGVSEARNRGIREARGGLVAFLDSDDEWEGEKLGRQVALLDAAPRGVGLVYTGSRRVGGPRDGEVFVPSCRGDVYREMLHRNVFDVGSSSVVAKKDVLDRVGGFDPSLPSMEDYDYWIRVARVCRVDFVPEPLVTYHDQAGDRLRRSRSQEANLEAMEFLYRKHGDEMRRLGVAWLFLRHRARRHLLSISWHPKKARELLRKALKLQPLAPSLYLLFALSLVGRPVYAGGARLKRALTEEGEG
jgi:glycosyltransferase involved in cell wall biosynthesis